MVYARAENQLLIQRKPPFAMQNALHLLTLNLRYLFQRSYHHSVLTILTILDFNLKSLRTVQTMCTVLLQIVFYVIPCIY